MAIVYLDSSVAYQGAGRTLDLADLEPIAWWAADHLVPDLTILLDLDPVEGLATIGERDRLESADDDFHARTRDHFLRLAERDPGRYLVVDARASITAIQEQIRARFERLESEDPETLQVDRRGALRALFGAETSDVEGTLAP